MLTNQIWNDAGLLREYAQARHAKTFACGGSVDAFYRARSIARRLAQLTKIDFDSIVQDLVADYEASE